MKKGREDAQFKRNMTERSEVTLATLKKGKLVEVSKPQSKQIVAKKYLINPITLKNRPPLYVPK